MEGEKLSKNSFFHELASLIEWRSAGHLTEAEFVAAKRKLGLM